MLSCDLNNEFGGRSMAQEKRRSFIEFRFCKKEMGKVS